MIIFALVVGIFNNLGTALEELITNFGFKNSSDNSSLFGALFLLCGLIGSGVFGAIADGTKKYKFLLLLSSFLSAGLLISLLFVFEARSVIWSSINISVLGFFYLPSLPLSFELAC